MGDRKIGSYTICDTDRLRNRDRRLNSLGKNIRRQRHLETDTGRQRKWMREFGGKETLGKTDTGKQTVGKRVLRETDTGRESERY